MHRNPAIAGLLAIACHVGRPPPSAALLSVGEVRAAAAEPALQDDLSRGLSGALADRGALGDGPEVRAEVLAAEVTPVATADGGQVRRARLQVAFELLGARPRRVVLTAERAYGAPAADTLAASSARADAFRALSDELSEEAADWFLYGPGGTP